MAATKSPDSCRAMNAAAQGERRSRHAADGTSGTKRSSPRAPSSTAEVLVDPSLFSIGQKHFSSHVTCGSFAFRLLVLPAGTAPMKGDQVSAFLVVNPGDVEDGSATFHSVSCEISVVNWLDSRKTIRKRDRWNFCGFGLDRGWHDMVATRRLTREEGWLDDGGLLCVRARCTPLEPTRAMRHGMFVQWLHTLNTRLSRRGDEPHEAEVLAALLLHGDLPREMPAELTCPLYSSTRTSCQQALERLEVLVREYPVVVAAAREDLASPMPITSGFASFSPEPAKGRPTTVLATVINGFAPKPAAQASAVRFLLLMRAEPNAACPGQGLTALHHCAMLQAHDPRGAVDALVAARVDVEARDAVHGRTPLAWSAREGSARAAEALLAQGANPHARDSLGETPVETALRLGHAEVASLLARASAAPAASRTCTPALHGAPEAPRTPPLRDGDWPLVRELEAPARILAARRAQAVAAWVSQRWRMQLPREAAALIARGCMDFPLWPAATVPVVPPRF